MSDESKITGDASRDVGAGEPAPIGAAAVHAQEAPDSRHLQRLLQDGLYCEVEDKNVPIAIDGGFCDSSVGLEERPSLLVEGYELIPTSLMNDIRQMHGWEKVLDLWQQMHDPNYGAHAEPSPAWRDQAVEWLRDQADMMVDSVRSGQLKAVANYISARATQSPAEADIEARIAVLSDKLKSISKNTYCTNCQEAALVARSALASYIGLARSSQPETATPSPAAPPPNGAAAAGPRPTIEFGFGWAKINLARAVTDLDRTILKRMVTDALGQPPIDLDELSRESHHGN
ncbi:hypothetical protein ACQR1Y_11930 [Bradyrhizobium sp. HKCCYLRH3099]|uniref:hypothetical protein n=1 Tax=unclassified Bradyrhizobium TaxID=2631580 RepID=UPI003EC0D1A4